MAGYSFFLLSLQPETNNLCKMKRTVIALSVAVAALMLVACKDKKNSEMIITQPVVKSVSSGPIRMPANTDSREVSWIGKTYKLTIHRQPADSLSMVKDDMGQQYIDNVFQLTVARQDGSVFFSRRFVKNDFARLVGDDFRKTGILEGFVFDKAEGDWLEFGASVGRPQTDEYIPLKIRLSRMGELDVKIDDQLDTNSDIDNQKSAADTDDDGV